MFLDPPLFADARTAGAFPRVPPVLAHAARSAVLVNVFGVL